MSPTSLKANRKRMSSTGGEIRRRREREREKRGAIPGGGERTVLHGVPNPQLSVGGANKEHPFGLITLFLFIPRRIQLIGIFYHDYPVKRKDLEGWKVASMTEARTLMVSLGGDGERPQQATERDQEEARKGKRDDDETKRFPHMLVPTLIMV
ncbi:hypothetical protein GW17_00008364 [Ensete ventricosum]